MKKCVLLLAILFAAKFSFSQVTWSGKVASIIYNNCSNCHNANGIAPMALLSYQDAVDNSDDIQNDVTIKKMPPWPPNPEYSRLAHERFLTQQQINDISDWVSNGMPRGDSTTEPAPPVFNNISEISNPDLVLPCPHFAVNTTTDLYRCFVVPSTLTVDKYLTGIEAIPGDRSIVHHVLIYMDTTNLPAALDALDPAPGYTFFGGTGSPSSKLIGTWVPGQRAYFTPAGMGIRLPANCKIVLQVHYPRGITNRIDSTKLFLRLSSTFQREITIDAPLNHFNLDHNAQLIIPANTTRTFTAHANIPSDVSVLGVGPHMHLIGQSIYSFGVTPSNDTIPFIDIPSWDFHWQGAYSFPKVLKIPAGSTIYSSAFYDNTTANDENPNNPPQEVRLGESTTDEMMLVYFSYLPYQPGDENIIIDSTSLTTSIIPIENRAIASPQLYDPSPNPVRSIVTYEYFLPQVSDVNITICDLQGNIVREEKSSGEKQGLVTSHFDLSELSSGVYFLTMKAGGVMRAKKFLKE